MISQQPRSMPPSLDLDPTLQGTHDYFTPPLISPPAARPQAPWRWLLMAMLGCTGAGVAALGAFLWLVNLPPTTNCENPATVTSDRAQLYCAQTAAESGNLEDILTSLDLVGAWSSSHPLHYEVQPLVEEWSWVALRAAERELGDNQLQAAQALIARIPSTSPVYPQGQAALARWQTEWDQGRGLVAKAEKALQRKDWTTATAQLQALGNLENDHWRVEQVTLLSRRIQAERRAVALLNQAVALAAPGGSQGLGRALQTATQINPDTFTYQAAQVYLDRWSDLLLKLGLDRWYASSLEEALALARQAALNPSRAQVAQELIWLSRSRQLAQASLRGWRTTPDQLITLYQAMLMANRIGSDSPYYGQAQSSLKTWRQHLEGMATLQAAEVPGRLVHLDTLKLAMTQAQQIPPGHPQRVRAQTLIAHWQLTIERLEDRPYLVEAHRLAKDKTMAGLQAAIEMAEKIALERALRPEAQGWVYLWRVQIEEIEDRPILNQARRLASQGNLFQAIAEALNVKPGRALYDEAQGAIAGWQWQIRQQELARQRALTPTPPLIPTLPAPGPSTAIPPLQDRDPGALTAPSPSPEPAPATSDMMPPGAVPRVLELSPPTNIPAPPPQGTPSTEPSALPPAATPPTGGPLTPEPTVAPLVPAPGTLPEPTPPPDAPAVSSSPQPETNLSWSGS
ncbi:MAG: hypothetical protein ACKO21_06010 [Nodosilinea sp.]